MRLDRGRPNGMGRPPWDEIGADDYLPAATTTGGGENSTEPIAEQTMGPLLIWAMRVVERPVADICRLGRTAAATRESPHRYRNAYRRAALEAYLRPLTDGQAPVPVTVTPRSLTLKRQPGRLQTDLAYSRRMDR